MIVIPNAGGSTRFKRAGVETHKFMLPLGNMTLFDHVISSFRDYYASEPFLVIARNNPEEISFLENKMRAHGIRDFEVIGLDQGGQGMLADICGGLKKTRFSLRQPAFIHPVDIIRRNFKMPRLGEKVFSMDFERMTKGVGSYHISNVADFLELYERSRALSVRRHMGERSMEIVEFIRFVSSSKWNGYKFARNMVPANDIVHCGIPDQYLHVLGDFMQENPTFPFGVNDTLLFTNDVNGIKIRNQMIQIWLDSIRQKHGFDNKTSEYMEAISGYAWQVVQATEGHHMGPALKAHIINELSETVQSQLPLAERLENIAYPDTHIDVDIDSLKIKNAPSLFTFLSGPYSQEAAAAFLSDQTDFPQGNNEAKKFYAHFWGMKPEMRVDVISRILGVNQGSDLAFKLSLRRSIQDLLDDFLPPDIKGSRARSYGLAFATQLAMSATQEELGFLATHILDSVHKDKTQPPSDDEEIRFGYRLASCLMGVGAAKVAQGKHSFAQTPKKWKEGLGQTKSNVLPMRRVDFVRKAMQLPDDVSSGIDRIGARLGTGTYIDTKAVFFTPDYLEKNPAMAAEQSENGLVLQLVKENSGALSSRIFALTVRTLKNFVATNQEAQQSMGGFIPVIEHKAQMIREETDLSIIAQKSMVAENLLTGVSVKIGKLTAAFSGAGVFKSGPEFKISRNIPGKHFNQLPENTREERALKSSVAEAIFTAEMFMITSGRPFNHDPHGDNQGIEITISSDGTITVHIGNFDDGAIKLQPPSEKQQRLFANIIMDSVANSAINGFNPISSLKHTFSKAQVTSDLSGKDNADDLSYVDAMVEAVVSLGDYTKHMDTRAFVRSLRAVYAQNGIAPIISKTFGDRFSSIQKMKNGEADIEEEARRLAFYPPPTEEKKKFTSPLNRLFGRGIMTMGSSLLHSGWVSHVSGTGKIIIPAGYVDRLFDATGP